MRDQSSIDIKNLAIPEQKDMAKLGPSQGRKYHAEVLKTLRQHSVETTPQRQAETERYMRSQHLKYLGLSSPQQRALNKEGYSFYDLPEEKILAIWDYIWNNSTYSDVMNQAIIYMENRCRQPGFERHWPLLKSWAKHIGHWGHSDGLSKLYAILLETTPDKVYPVLARWNRSKNLWLRRQSVVSLLYYATSRKTVLPFAKMAPLVEALIADPEYYVQKGVGWTLRELGNIYPKETMRLIEQHLGQWSAIAFTTSMEKVDKSKKEQLKARRRQMRQAAKSSAA